MIVLPSEIVEIIRDLACKTPGLDGLTSEHMQLSIDICYADSWLYAQHILTSVMVPIIKNKNKSSTDNNN